MTDYVLVQFKLPEGSPSLKAAASRLGVAPGRLDAQYGVVPTDPDAGLFTVMLDAALTEKVQKRLTRAIGDSAPDPAEGVFANPRVEPFDIDPAPRP